MGGCGNDGVDSITIGAIITAGLVVAGSVGVLFLPRDVLSSKGKRKSSIPAAAAEANDQNSPEGFIPCVSISKRLATCLQGNAYDMKNCQSYFDLVKECQKN